MSLQNKETWVIISHSFNMDGRASSLTITDKIPHLLKCGVEPIIISSVSGQLDERLEHHQLWPWFPSGLRFDIRHWLKKKIERRWLRETIKSVCTLLLFPFYAIERLLLPLEPHWSWVFPATLKGVRCTARHNAKVIYSTGGANSAHLAGYWASKWTNLTWIAEIHDPMIHEGMKGSKLRYRWAEWLEGIICRNAHVVWWFTDTALERAKARHPSLGSRGHVILPGGKEPNFQNTVYQRNQQFHLGHFGMLNNTRNLATLLHGLKAWLRENPNYTDSTCLNIYGSQLDSTSKSIVEELELTGLVMVHGRLEHDPITQKSGRQRVLEAMRTMDVLILLHGTGNFCEEYVPSKLYEYQWTKRPILALTRNNTMLDGMIDSLGGTAVQADDVQAAKEAIGSYFDKWQEDNLKDLDHQSHFTTEACVQKILDCVKEVS